MSFRGFLREGTATDVMLGPFLDDTDGKTPETALTLTQPDVRLSKAGGLFAQKNAAQTLSHNENGYYPVNLNATDLNTRGLLTVGVFEAGALIVRQDYMVLSAAHYDLQFGALPAGIIAYGTAQSGSASGIRLAAATSFADDLIVGSIIAIISGTGFGQTRAISDWVSATDDATVSPNWSVSPDGTSVYLVLSSPPAVTDPTLLPLVDTRKINNVPVLGAGTAGNLWRG